MSLRWVWLALAAAVVFVSGVWMTRAGRPHSGLLLNVHKLVDLAAVVYMGIAFYRAYQDARFTPATWMLLAAMALVAMALFASGGVISAMGSAPVWVVRLHRVGSWIGGALAAASVWAVGVR